MAKHDTPLPDNLVPVGDKCIPLFVPNDPDYVTMIVEHLRRLTLDYPYERDANFSALIVREQWANRMFAPLLAAITAENECQNCNQADCIEHSPYASFVDFLPQNPFSQPDYIPGGYNNPPFWAFFYTWDTFLPDVIDDTLIDIAEWTTGYQKGDVLLPITGFPINAGWNDLLTEGLPRIRVNVQGEGTLELHLLNVPLGGRAMVTLDNSLSPIDVINGIITGGFTMLELNRDIFSIPPETEPVYIHEVTIDTPGSHYVDIIFMPTVDDSLIPLNYGGGLRKVVLCGGLQPEGADPLPDPLEDYTDVIPEFQLNATCGLEYRLLDAANGNAPLTGWLAVQGWSTNADACFAGADGAPGADGLDGIDGLDGTDGAPGVDGQINTYPPLPDASVPDALCGSSYYIANQLNALVADAISSTQSETLADYMLNVLDAVQGVVADAISTMWSWLGTNYYAGLASDVSAESVNVAEALYCSELDKTATKAWINSSGISQTVKDAYTQAIDSVTDGKWSLWAYLGSLDTSQDCSGFACNAVPYVVCEGFDLGSGTFQSDYIPNPNNALDYRLTICFTSNADPCLTPESGPTPLVTFGGISGGGSVLTRLADNSCGATVQASWTYNSYTYPLNQSLTCHTIVIVATAAFTVNLSF